MRMVPCSFTPSMSVMRTRDSAAGGRAPAAGSRFAAYVAHELRTPIAHQRLLAEAALADPLADPRAICEEVIGACDHQLRLIDALFDLTRSSPLLLRHERVDLALVTRRVLNSHDLRDLDRAVALDPAAAQGDRALIERLCDNLVSNAIRHNVPGGRIEVTTTTAAGGAMLSVANTGPAVADGELARLFQPFARGPRRGGSTDGLGLGLAIVDAIAGAHEAVVAARPRAGGGLAIEVSFPTSR
jgi:signal transduction histidine kinase